jgi:hypothetical protein
MGQLGPPTLRRLNLVLQLHFLGSITSSIWAGRPRRRATSPGRMVHQSKCPICPCAFHFPSLFTLFLFRSCRHQHPHGRGALLLGFDACDCEWSGISSKTTTIRRSASKVRQGFSPTETGRGEQLVGGKMCILAIWFWLLDWNWKFLEFGVRTYHVGLREDGRFRGIDR